VIKVSSQGQESPSSLRMVNVRGMVVDSRTGRPLDAVHVMLTYYGSNTEPSIIYGAMTNAQGRFSIPNIPDGNYSVLSEKHGFTFVPNNKKGSVRLDGSAWVQFKAGERLDDLVLRMVASAIIAGRVLDEHGDALMNANVTAMPVTRGTGVSGLTNGRGEFRFSVPPGRYYVAASTWSDAEATEDPRGSPARSGYVQTFYPGSPELESATPVEAFAGRVLNGVEIRLERPAAFQVSGEITGLPEGGRSFSVFWRTADASTIGKDSTSDGRVDLDPHEAARDGSSIKFYSAPLHAGTYYFYAVSHTADAEFQSQIVSVTLSDADQTGITLTLGSGVEITGSIVFIRQPAFPNQQISVLLHSEGPTGFGISLEGKMDAKSRFRVSNVFPDRYRLEISPMPENSFVQSIDMNGSLVHGRLLDLLSGAAGMQLKIIISGGAARITGEVQKKSTLVPAPGAEVLLFPEHEGLGLDEEECQTVTADSNGRYSYRGLAPGHYRVVARSGFANDECKQASVAMRRGMLAAARVELRARIETVKNLQIVDEASDESGP
jgi:hypothetical protein